MNNFNCEILADSLSPQGERCTTFVCRFPRMILAEMNTHRMFSRNSASSRAIPFKKMVEMVEENPFIPIAWQKDHKGMQGDEYFTDEDQVKPTIYPVGQEGKNHYKVSDILKTDWLRARNNAVYNAKAMSELGLTKQIVNRLLEPFMWHTAIITSTEFENFFNLRCPQYVNEHEGGKDISRSRKDFIKKLQERYPTNWKTDLVDFHGIKDNTDLEWLRINESQAEIHIQKIAELMWDARNESTPKQLSSGEWHIPFGDNISNKKLREAVAPESLKEGFVKTNNYMQKKIEGAVKIATARCARVSYLNFEGKDDYEADIKLHDRLASMGHWSPFEHCARAMSNEEYNSHIRGRVLVDKEDGYYTIEGPSEDTEFGWSGNLRGFLQYRKMFVGENRKENMTTQ